MQRTCNKIRFDHNGAGKPSKKSFEPNMDETLDQTVIINIRSKSLNQALPSPTDPPAISDIVVFSIDLPVAFRIIIIARYFASWLGYTHVSSIWQKTPQLRRRVRTRAELCRFHTYRCVGTQVLGTSWIENRALVFIWCLPLCLLLATVELILYEIKEIGRYHSYGEQYGYDICNHRTNVFLG